MELIKQVESNDIENILSYLYEVNRFSFEYIKQRNRNFRYVFEHTSDCLVYCVKEEFFKCIDADKLGLKEYIESRKNDFLDVTGERFSALNAELVGNYAIAVLNGLNENESITFNSVPYTIFKYGFNQSDTGHLNMKLGYKSSNLFTNRTFVIETKNGFEDEVLICKCSIRELYQYIPEFYNAFEEYKDYDYFYFILGVLQKEIQEKYLKYSLDGLKNHKSKKEITYECFEELVSILNYDFSRTCSIIHNVNLLNNKDAHKELCLVLLSILKVNNIIDIPLSNNECLKYIFKWNNLKFLVCRDSKNSKIMKYDLYQLVYNRVQKIRELVFNPDEICSEDFIFENSLNNCIIMGVGVRSLLEILQKNCENKNINIQKTCLFIDESDIADVINSKLSLSLKSKVLKEVTNRKLKINLDSIIILDMVIKNYIRKGCSVYDKRLKDLYNVLELLENKNSLYIYRLLLCSLIGLLIVDLEGLKVNFRFPPYIKDISGFYVYSKLLSESIQQGKVLKFNLLGKDNSNIQVDSIEDYLQDWISEIEKIENK